MATLPLPIHTTRQAIVEWYEKKPQDHRAHMGASEIGKPCDRALWYSFRWTTPKHFSGRVLRLFDTGFREETRLLEELRGIGVEIHDIDPRTQRQHRFEAVQGHFGGSCDGIGRGFPESPATWAVVEFKTHSAKSFADLSKHGVEKSKPEHYAQVNIYMGLAELDRAMYIGVNKDTDDIYSEWIHFDKECFDALLERADKLINLDEPPLGISTDPAWYQCKFCDHSPICHGEIAASKNCRTCVHSSPASSGQWWCDSHKRVLPLNEQRIGCRSHLVLPPLVGYAEAIDAGTDYIKYQHKDTGLEFLNATEDAAINDGIASFTSTELAVAVRSLMADKLTGELKAEFPDSKLVNSHDEKSTLWRKRTIDGFAN